MAIGRCILYRTKDRDKDKDKDQDKDKETKVPYRGRTKDKSRRTRKQIQRLRKEERKAKASRGGKPRLLIDNLMSRGNPARRKPNILVQSFHPHPRPLRSPPTRHPCPLHIASNIRAPTPYLVWCDAVTAGRMLPSVAATRAGDRAGTGGGAGGEAGVACEAGGPAP